MSLLRCNQSSCCIQTKSIHDVLTNELCLPLSSVDDVKQLSTPLSVLRGVLHLASHDPTSLYTHQVMCPSTGQVESLHNVNREGKGMKGRVDKSMGIVSLIAEACQMVCSFVH